jgi:hypothetical protein
MLGSTLDARRLVPFPAPVMKARAPRRLGAKLRRTLLAAAGEAISGKQTRAKPLGQVPAGALIFAYERGVHRFLKRAKLPRVGTVVLHEPVFTSKLEPQSGEVLSCVPGFCELVPPRIARSLGGR